MPPFSWTTQAKPYICLAPMAGYTDSAFRKIVKEIAPHVITFSEMVSSDGLKYNSRTNQNLMRYQEIERPYIVQLFGKVPENFAIAAKIAEEIGANGIDINMGCPAHKVIKSNHGAALIQNPVLAQEIVAATVQATKLPVSVKTRLGWKDDAMLIDFCKGIEKAGASAITIHGRTYQQSFTGLANWEPIYHLKKEITIPIIGNGDIRSVEDAISKLKKLDGFMVGRATFGNPWLMQELDEYFYLKEKSDPRGSVKPQCQNKPSPNDIENFVNSWLKYKKPIILKHARYAVKMKGERIAMNEMRKHLAMYVKGLPNATELRKQLVLVEKLEEIDSIFTQVKTN